MEWSNTHPTKRFLASLNYLLCYALLIAPFVILVTSFLLYRYQRRCFWIGVLTFLSYIVFLLLPLVPAID